jgi:purine-binding chemotaxis protein CheW
MTEAEHKYLIFTLQGRRFALDLAQVAEVDEPQVTWPIPGAPPCYSGAMNFHGTIVAVMDLAAFLGLQGDHRLEKLVVLNADIAALAFQVERVERIVAADQLQFDGQIEPADMGISSGTLLLDNGAALLLDAALLARQAAERISG